MPTISADGKYYIDHSLDPTFTPGSFVSIYPENLQFDDVIGDSQSNGVGNCSYEISFSALDQDGNPVVTGHDFIGPYRTYFRLRYGDVAIMSGPVVSWHTKLGEDFMTVAGKTWEHYFERWQYPFNPLSPNAYRQANTFENDELIASGTSTPTGLAYQAFHRDIIYIISDIISNTMNLVPHREIFDLSLLTGLSGIKTNYQLSLGDTSYMDQIIMGLAGLGNGFNWWIDAVGKKLYWASPYRYGNPSAPSYIATFDGSTPALTPSNLEFENVGPAATHELGTGAGLAVQTQLGIGLGDGTNQTTFTRLDKNYDFGDVRNRAQLEALARKQFVIDLNPQHRIPFQLDPARILNFWSDYRPGRAVFINYDMVAHQIDSGHQLKSYSAKSDNEGNVLVDFTLQQIYDTSILGGHTEG